MGANDPFLHQNLTEDQINQLENAMRSQVIDGVPLDPRDIFRNPERFNSYPLQVRQKVFEKVLPATGPTAQYIDMATNQVVPQTRPTSFEPTQVAQAQPETQTDVVSNLILGQELPQAKPEKAMPTDEVSALILGPDIEAARSVSTVKTARQKAAERSQQVAQEKVARRAAYADVIAGAPAAITQTVGYWINRIRGMEPEQATAAAEKISKPLEMLTAGKATGTAETEAYKGAIPSQVMTYIGENIEKGAEALSKETGIAAKDIQEAINAGLIAAPVAGKAVMGKTPIVPPAPKIEPTMGGAPKPRITYKEFQQQFAEKKGTPTMPAATPSEPFVAPDFAPNAYKGKVNLPEQDIRRSDLAELGLTEARPASIYGNKYMAGSDYQSSLLHNPLGEYTRNIFANERNALENYTKRIIEKTGGSVGLDENTLRLRGERIAAPFDEFKQALTNQMTQAYDQAKQVAAGQPVVQPSNFQQFLNKNSEFTVNDSFKSLRNGIKDHLRENNLIDKKGNVLPMTVEQAENLRKYINSNWNSERSGLIGRLKDKIDNDVTKVAGEDVYKSARNIRTKISRLLDDPKGVAKIMDYDPQTPINRAVSYENIPKTIENLSVDQANHLVRLLREMPDELRPQADRAIGEIKGHFLNRVLEQGSKNKEQWNAKDVTKYLNEHSGKLKTLMDDPETARMIGVLNRSGHYLKYDSKYPGAAVQAHNLIKLGAAPFLGTIGGALGTAAGGGGPLTAITAPAGAAFGAKKGVALAEKSALKKAQKRMIPLSDVLKPKE